MLRALPATTAAFAPDWLGSPAAAPSAQPLDAAEYHRPDRPRPCRLRPRGIRCGSAPRYHRGRVQRRPRTTLPPGFANWAVRFPLAIAQFRRAGRYPLRRPTPEIRTVPILQSPAPCQTLPE